MTKAVRVIPRGASADVHGVVVRSLMLPVVTSVRWLRWGIGLVALQLGVADDSSARTGQTSAACTFAGHKLYGRIQVVKQHADLRVQVVEHFPDLRVKLVERFADNALPLSGTHGSS